jgi:hypothetical protein
MRPVFVGFAGCLAAIGGGGGGAGDGGLSREEIKSRAVPIGDPVKAGELTWTVTGAIQQTERNDLGERRTGNFIVVDLTVRNNGDEAVTAIRSRLRSWTTRDVLMRPIQMPTCPQGLTSSCSKSTLTSHIRRVWSSTSPRMPPA